MAQEDLGYVDPGQGKKMAKAGNFDTAKKWKRVVVQLMKHPRAAPFCQPVHMPGYTKVIKEPMDLSTVKKRLKDGEYNSSAELIHDVGQIWDNAWRFNEPGSDIFLATTEMSRFFEQLLAEMGEEQIPSSKKAVSQPRNSSPKLPSSPLAITPSKSSGSLPLTAEEKTQLKHDLVKIPPEKLRGVIELTRGKLGTRELDTSYEFDLDLLAPDVVRELERYVKNYLVTDSLSNVPPPSTDPMVLRSHTLAPQITEPPWPFPQNPGAGVPQRDVDVGPRYERDRPEPPGQPRKVARANGDDEDDGYSVPRPGGNDFKDPRAAKFFAWSAEVPPMPGMMPMPQRNLMMGEGMPGYPLAGLPNPAPFPAMPPGSMPSPYYAPPGYVPGLQLGDSEEEPREDEGREPQMQLL